MIPPSKDEVIIRTMKDDLAGLDNATKSSVVRSAEATAPPSFPLPPGNNGSQKIVISPEAPHKRNKIWIVAVIALCLVAALGGGGWYAFTVYTSSQSQQLQETAVQNAAQILPKDASLIIGYNFKNPQDRAAILAAWQKNGTKTSFTDLLNGNPLALLNDQALHEMYIVTLSSDTRPYIITPETPTLTALLENNNQTPVARKNGWVIIHQVRTDTYTQALALGSLEGTSNAFLFSNDQPGPIRLLMSGSFIDQLMQESTLKMASFGLGSIRLVGQFTTTGLVLSGNIADFKAATLASNQVEQRLVTALPADILTAYLGGDFSGDIQQAQQAKIIDVVVSNQPAIAQLIKTLNGSYAYYTRLGADQLQDWGLVIQIPSSLQATLKLGDPVLEQGLHALVPIITGRSLVSQIAFADGAYNDIPLRYFNLSDTSQALDYTITNGYLVIATSKEGIFTLLNTLHGSSLSLEAGTIWQPLLSMWGSLPVASNFFFSTVKNPLFVQLLPHTPSVKAMPLGVGIDLNSNDGKVQAALLF